MVAVSEPARRQRVSEMIDNWAAVEGGDPDTLAMALLDEPAVHVDCNEALTRYAAQLDVYEDTMPRLEKLLLELQQEIHNEREKQRVKVEGMEIIIQGHQSRAETDKRTIKDLVAERDRLATELQWEMTRGRQQEKYLFDPHTDKVYYKWEYERRMMEKRLYDKFGTSTAWKGVEPIEWEEVYE